MGATTCRLCDEPIIGNTHECPLSTLRERCEKLADELYHAEPNLRWDEHLNRVESFAREILQPAQEVLKEFGLEHARGHTMGFDCKTCLFIADLSAALAAEEEE